MDIDRIHLMKISPFRFTFKPVAATQCELIHRWLEQDDIRKSIHGQGLQNTLTSLETFIHHQAEGKGLDRQTTITQHWIGYDGNIPFVYLLTTNVFTQAPDEYAKYKELDGPAITLDIFIGNQDYLGKGLAKTIIKEFLLSQFSDVSEVFIDPEKNNKRAIHVYQQVGFRIVGEFIASWHPVPHHVMKLKMSELEK